MVDKFLDKITRKKVSPGDYYAKLTFYKIFPESQKLESDFYVISGKEIEDLNVWFKCLEIENYKILLEQLFPNFKIIDNQKSEKPGCPDFKIVTDSNETFYIEIKNKQDGIRRTQLDWLYENKKNVYYLFISNIKIFSDKKEDEVSTPERHGNK